MNLVPKYYNARGFTLVEVMIATLIFSMLAISTTSVFIQNNRVMATLRYRTHATNAALSVVEQLRLHQFSTIKSYHDVAASTILVSLADPTYTRPIPDRDLYPAANGMLGVPDGYRPIPLKINVIDNVEKIASWTPVELPLETSANAPKLKAQFWTTINANISISSPVVEVYEIVVVYQWRNPASSAPWQSGTVRLVVPNPNPRG